jgi:hypothetical protein
LLREARWEGRKGGDEGGRELLIGGCEGGREDGSLADLT